MNARERSASSAQTPFGSFWRIGVVYGAAVWVAGFQAANWRTVQWVAALGVVGLTGVMLFSVGRWIRKGRRGAFLSAYYILGAFGISVLASSEEPGGGVAWLMVAPFVLARSSFLSTAAVVKIAFVGASAGGVTRLVQVMAGLEPAAWPDELAALMPPYVTAFLAYTLAAGRPESTKNPAGVVGSYRLETRLSEGGMGEVWRARHRVIGRWAAVKLVQPEKVSEKLGEDPKTVFRRFEREARTTANLTSPHIITLFDYGYTSMGAFYYVMELLDGFDLETMVRKFGPLPPERAVFLLIQVCDALEDTHRAGIVHRDIKPANIYACRLGAVRDFVKVIDFGLVTSSEEAQNQMTRLTTEGLTSGTPAYMAPEMAKGQLLDARADLYAVGCVAYWLLTGHLVFESKSTMKMLADHVKTPPASPSSHLTRPLPESLEQLVMDCLAKDPERRPQNATELSERLRGLESPWTRERADAWWEVYAPVKLRSGIAPRDEAHEYAGPPR